MWQKALVLVACMIALPASWQAGYSAAAERPAAEALACDGVGAPTGRLERGLFERDPEPGGLAYRAGRRLDVVTRPRQSRHRVASWIAQSAELARVWPYTEAPMCTAVRSLGLSEIQPGLAVGRTGDTVTVVGDRRAVNFRAEDGAHRLTSDIAGDIVVNANWFTPSGTQAPVVMAGELRGGADAAERGQLLARRPNCGGTGPSVELQHLWTGETYQHDRCVVAAVSGVSLIHNGVRADAYPGYNITTGYTNTSRSHSFIGFNGHTIVIVATREMTASQLADYAISLGVTEGVMLDGGGSTQIATPTVSLRSARAVPAFAILDSIY